MVMDIRVHDRCTFALFNEACKRENALPLSDCETGLKEWVENPPAFPEPEAINNVALIMATTSRHVSCEWLTGIKTKNADTLTLTFNFMKDGAPKDFSIDISAAEMAAILADPLPIRQAVKITDTRMQIGLAGG
jgi:hypothetical protein